MPTCAICKKTNQFLRIEAFGVCSDCYPAHGGAIQQAIEGIAQEATVRDRLKDSGRKLDSISRSLEHCQALTAFGALPGLEATAQLPAELEAMRTGIVEDEIRDAWFWARERFKDLRQASARLDAYSGAISRVQDLLPHLPDGALVEKAVIVMRAERDRLAFELTYNKAQLAETKGKKARALELYIEAAFHLAHDMTPDAYQTELRERVEAKIRSMGGEPRRLVTS